MWRPIPDISPVLLISIIFMKIKNAFHLPLCLKKKSLTQLLKIQNLLICLKDLLFLNLNLVNRDLKDVLVIFLYKIRKNKF